MRISVLIHTENASAGHELFFAEADDGRREGNEPPSTPRAPRTCVWVAPMACLTQTRRASEAFFTWRRRTSSHREHGDHEFRWHRWPAKHKPDAPARHSSLSGEERRA